MRPSTEQKLETAGAALARLVVGLILFAFGGIFDYLEYKSPPTPFHTTRIGIFTGIALGGVVLLPTIFDALFPRVQKVFVLVFPNGLPMLGGRRAGDPPVPPAPPSTPPSQGTPPSAGGGHSG